MSKRKASTMGGVDKDDLVDPADELMFLCLGGGNEVGRSCHIIQYKGKTVMLDAGQHPAYSGLASLPFFDDFDLSSVDVLLISHFHIDHAASLPYVLAKTNFRGRVFMTHPTKAIYKWLIQDSVRVGNTSSQAAQAAQAVYNEQDHLSTFSQIEAIDYHTTHTVSSIRITPYPAGHVLGAAMFLIEIAGLNIFFTGDYSREQDRHLVSAEVPRGVKIDVLITESTYGVSSHTPRLEREQALMKSVTGILHRGGRVLMPVFALGRAQELLLILDEYWTKHPELHRVPIYYASNLARKCMMVYQTYVSAMNDHIKQRFAERLAEAASSGDASGRAGPWDFKFVRSLKNLDRFDDVGSCVMLASPGMLQNGVSRELLERWAPSDKNGVVMTGYSVEGTMAKQLLQEPDQIPAVSSRTIGHARRLGAGGDDDHKIMVPRRCSVDEYSFAAHVDGNENREFIEEVGAPVVILVHGEIHNMMRLKSKLLSLNANKSQKVKVFSPRNCEELRIPFRSDKFAKVVGQLASIPPPRRPVGPDSDDAQLLSGVLVQNDFKYSIMTPGDLREFAGLNTTAITCRRRFTLATAGPDLIRWVLESTFGAIEELDEMERSEAASSQPIKDNTEELEDSPQSSDDEEEPSVRVKAESDDEKRANGSLVVADHQEVDDVVPPVRLVAGFLVMGCVRVRYRSNRELELEWEGNIFNDGIADSIIGIIMMAESSPAAVKRSSSSCSHGHESPTSTPKDTMSPPSDDHALPVNYHTHIEPEERLQRFLLFLEAQFGADNVAPIAEPKLATAEDDDANSDKLKDAQTAELERLHRLGIPVPGIEIIVDKMSAKVWLESLEVEANHKVFADRVRAVVERAAEVTAPLWG